MAELAKQFTPAADEVWRLQNGDDIDCRMFQHFADHGHYRGKGGTRQGIYVCTPGGRLLDSINSLDAGAVAALLNKALAEWHAAPEPRSTAEPINEPQHRWESSVPRAGLVLRSTNRDLDPSGQPTAPRAERWNRDHVWFSAAEARQWLPDAPQPGQVYALPAALAGRLVRLHLVDNARGQTLPFAPQEILHATVTVTVTAIAAGVVHVDITGTTTAHAAGPWLLDDNDWKPQRETPHGMSTTLRGSAAFDTALQRFVAFEMVALGRHWGATDNNARWQDPAPGLIGWLFQLSPPDAPADIPPAFIDLYDAVWVRPPAP